MSLIFVKLGGSLITDKRREATVRFGVLRRLAHELREAREINPALQVVLGHGSGSFGHWEASHHGTRQGAHTPAQWQGFAKVSAAAARLNRIVTDTFLEAGLPVLSLQPSASAQGEGGTLTTLALEPLRQALAQRLIPLIYGDVAFDTAWGGTIFSTEDLFVYLTGELHPEQILLVGNAPGVLDDARQVIARITPASYPAVAQFLGGSGGVDVTGGMADKVSRMLKLAQATPGLRVWILSGRAPGNLRQALLEPEKVIGTLLCAEA